MVLNGRSFFPYLIAVLPTDIFPWYGNHERVLRSVRMVHLWLRAKKCCFFVNDREFTTPRVPGPCLTGRALCEAHPCAGVGIDKRDSGSFFITMGKNDGTEPAKNHGCLSYLLIFKHAIFPVCGERSFQTPLSMKS